VAAASVGIKGPLPVYASSVLVLPCVHLPAEQCTNQSQMAEGVLVCAFQCSGRGKYVGMYSLLRFFSAGVPPAELYLTLSALPLAPALLRGGMEGHPNRACGL
jgi:hypothetical protein